MAAQGGMTGKPAPKVNKNNKRILSGTGSTTKPMPELRKTGGVGGPAVKPKATPKVTPKAKPSAPSMVDSTKLKRKFTQLPRKTR